VTALGTRSTTTARTRWRTAASVGEGLANLRDGALLGAVLVAITTLVVAAALLVDVLTAARVLTAERDYLAAGGDLLVAQSAGPQGLDAGRCAALADVQGGRAAAALTVVPGAAHLVGRPESQQTLVTATAGILDLLDVPVLPDDGVVVSRVIADRWQWAPGSHLQLDAVDARAARAPSDVLTVAAVRDLALLSEGASTGVLMIRPPVGDADQCFVRIDPQYRDDLRDTIPAVLGETAANAVNVSDRLPPGALAQDPVAAYEGRTTRWAAGAAGLVVGLLWGVVAWTRRGRAALYASVGVPYSGGVLIRWTEGGGVVLLGVLWGAALAATVAVCTVDVPVGVALALVVRGGGLALALAVAVVVLVGLWRPPTLAALKDR
jgi:hypothetical protein